MSEFTPTDRSRLRRLPQRAAYDRDTIYPILDEGMICHVGFVVENQPFVIPTIYGRVEDALYIHGSMVSRMLKTLQKGVPVSLAVTLLDGLVLARSSFHHSMNYRSVVVFGTGTLVTDGDERLAALRAISDHLVPGRWTDARFPSAPELAQTSVVRIAIEEATAKARTGPPMDDEEDYDLPVWAGVVPFNLTAGPPVPDPRLTAGIPVPDYLGKLYVPKS